MKVLLINGSPHKDGCTARALKEVSDTLNHEGIETDNIFIGNKDIRGCIGCFTCNENKKCVFDDIVNETAKKFEYADGIVIGTPVYYSGLTGTLKSFIDRLFFSTKFDKTMKVGTVVISSRRAGSTSVYDEINKFYGICGMPIVTSTYWNEVHGYTKDDVEKDLEGLQTMRNLGRNMAFLIKAISSEKKKNGMPKNEYGVFTNFQDGL
ncbi:MAG: flavodoxin family protein [Bacteroidetes bacterium]|nr:flavodoxin family protein [Bacteroidota bacterium]